MERKFASFANSTRQSPLWDVSWVEKNKLECFRSVGTIGEIEWTATILNAAVLVLAASDHYYMLTFANFQLQ